MGVCSPSTFGVELGAGGVASVAALAVNPNLLTWTEQLDNAAWVKAGAAVSANAGTDPRGGGTADRITFSGGTVRQTSAVTAATAAFTADISLATSPTRVFAAGLIDGVAHVYSCWLWTVDVGSIGAEMQLKVDINGSLVRCGLFDVLGDNPIVLTWGHKLEIGSTPTGDETNYGMRTT